MAKIKFTSALRRFFPQLCDLECEGESVQQVIQSVEEQFPGIQDYILEEDGSLRKHVNIFLKEELIQDRNTLTDAVNASDEILVFQALSGG